MALQCGMPEDLNGARTGLESSIDLKVFHVGLPAEYPLHGTAPSWCADADLCHHTFLRCPCGEVDCVPFVIRMTGMALSM
jgi:hypothetical protein